MKLAKNTRIIVGISGGVDSAVTALLLKQQGYEVSGIFMRNWEADQEDPYCTATQDLLDASKVCEQIQIPLQAVNFSKQYWGKVFQYFLDEYAAGRTPNPDILCNQEIKFKAFLDYALSQGADYIATGHYAQIIRSDGGCLLVKGEDNNKDQSYFLYRLNQYQLNHSLFPLGTLLKSEVRTIAKNYGLNNYAKKDSTGICFIGERKFKEFLSEYLLAKPGNIETVEGEIIGKHNGLMFYTLGQRQGLGIGGRKHAVEAPWYVLKKDITRNTLIVGQQRNHALLMSTELICHNVHWISGEEPKSQLTCLAKTRYRQSDQACSIQKVNDTTYKVIFAQPQWAVTPGQSVVFYQGNNCLGGGIIENSN